MRLAPDKKHFPSSGNMVRLSSDNYQFEMLIIIISHYYIEVYSTNAIEDVSSICLTNKLKDFVFIYVNYL